MKKRNNQAFTLVELIVVITILAILGTIAFIMLQGYSRNSRDSVRITDISNLQKNLEIYISEKGVYPIPDNYANITYSGAIAWIEGTVGEGVIRNLDKINKKPLDPLTGNEYTYSITSLKSELQIGAISEGGQMGYNLLLSQTYAVEKKATAMIRGTYNDRFLKVQSGTTSWVLAMPSIIATDISEPEIQILIDNNKLVYNNYANIPHSYNSYGYPMTGGFNYTNGNPLIYSGSIKILAEDNQEKIIFIDNLKEAYNGTILQGDPNYQDIVNLDTKKDQTDAVNLVNNYINLKVGGMGVSGMQKIPMSNLICGLNYKEVNGVCVESSKEGESCIGLPTNAIWNSINTVTQTWNGINWMPSNNGTYNIIASSTECRYICDTGYHTEDSGVTCVSDILNSVITNGTGKSIWNGTSWEFTVSACETDYYNSGDNTCSSVGIGYYSDSTSTSRIACTNFSDNTSRDYTYTSAGGGINSCTATYTEKCGLDLYETSDGVCSAVGTGYYSANLNNTRTACTNNPDNASRDYTYIGDGNGINNCTTSYTELCGLDLYETSDGVCSAVGTGYYSSNLDNTRTACTNLPDNASRDYTYTSAGGGINSCTATYTEKCGVDLYETSDGVCSSVGTSYYSANFNNSRTACTNKPTYSTYTSAGGGSNNCSWSCDSSYSNNGTTCIKNSWNIGAYGACSVSCGGGTQTRTVKCNNYSGTLLNDSDCLDTKPALNQSCNTQACPTSGPYSYGSWGSCSVTCGGGVQYRSQYCYYDSCYSPQATSQSCNTQSCGPQQYICPNNTATFSLYTGERTTCNGQIQTISYCQEQGCSTADFAAPRVNGRIVCTELGFQSTQSCTIYP